MENQQMDDKIYLKKWQDEYKESRKSLGDISPS